MVHLVERETWSTQHAQHMLRKRSVAAGEWYLYDCNSDSVANSHAGFFVIDHMQVSTVKSVSKIGTRSELFMIILRNFEETSVNKINRTVMFDF